MMRVTSADDYDDVDDTTADESDDTASVPSSADSTMFSARQLPWMKIGTVIDDPHVTAAEAARLGGIDFDVELRPAGYWKAAPPRTDESDDEGEESPGEWIESATRRAVVRVDTDEWFSFVSTDYRSVQYAEAFEFMDSINPNYVAAGAMSGGRQGFMVVQLPDHLNANVTVDGVEDPHEMYVVLRTSHDLSKSIEVAVMMLRERCMNQLTLPSFTAGTPQRWGIRHVGDPHQQLEQAKMSLVNAVKYKEAFQRVTTQLASVSINDGILEKILERVLPARARRSEQIDAIISTYNNADTVGFNDNGWGAVNAVSDYFQWGRSLATRTNQSVFTSALAGDTAKYVNRTAQLVMSRA